MFLQERVLEGLKCVQLWKMKALLHSNFMSVSCLLQTLQVGVVL